MSSGIREFRLGLGLSQSEFSSKFGVKVKTLQNWEQGIRTTPDHVLFMMMRIVELEKSLEKKEAVADVSGKEG